MKQINAIKGMNDILPDAAHWWQYIEDTCLQVLQRNQYRKIATPLLEKTELFARTIGAETDIVGKEMYSFADRNDDSLTLRPEGTASCARAGIENGLFYNQQQRIWYTGPMFRRENPQKGRYRQFHQLGAEAYGWATPDIDAEVISLSQQMWQALGIKSPQLQINSLGDTQDRQRYRNELVAYLEKYTNELDEDSQRRLTSNPLRILDSKNAKTQELLADAPVLLDYLSDTCLEDFTTLQRYLTSLGIDFDVNPRLVRGLDYYNKTVFEWVYPGLGAQATVCAGGRYDGLVEQLGGKPTPAIGFAMGIERLIEIIKDQQVDVEPCVPDVYFMSLGDAAREKALVLSKQLRQQGIKVQLHCGDGSLKNQMKRADKSRAEYAAIIADDELQQQVVTLKALRSNTEQQAIPLDDFIKIMQQTLN